MANQGVSVTIDGSQLWNQLHEIDRRAKKVVEDYIKTESLKFQKDVRQQLTDNKSVITGNLRRSIAIERVHRFEYTVGTNVVYAPFVEFGTRRAREKPYFQPVLDRNSEKFKETLASLIRKAIT